MKAYSRRLVRQFYLMVNHRAWYTAVKGTLRFN